MSRVTDGTTPPPRIPPPVEGENSHLLQLQKPDDLHEKVFEKLKEVLIVENLEDISGGFYLVDIARINQILVGITSFGCGQQQLVQLTEACKARDIKLAFVESSMYGCDFTKYSPENKILYITLPPTPQTENVIAIASLNEITQELEFNVINTGEEILRQNGGKTLEGYIIGHELSHAMSFVMCLETETGNKISKLLDQRDDYAFLLENLEVDSNEENLKFLEKNLFFGGGKPDDFRNLFGLGKDDKGLQIIGEFHYLNELLAGKIRTPYNKCALLPLVGLDMLLEFDQLTLDEIMNQVGRDTQVNLFKELCTQRKAETFEAMNMLNEETKTKKLKDDSVAKKVFKDRFKVSKDKTLSELKVFVTKLIQAVYTYHNQNRLNFKDMERVLSPQVTLPLHQTQPTTLIDTFLAGHNLERRDVRGEGNCGIWAVLKAMDPNIDYLNPETPNKGTGQWEKMMGIRQTAAALAESNEQHESYTRILTDRTWITTDDIQYIAQTIERPIGIIMPNQHGNNELILTAYEADGNVFARNDDEPLGDFLTRFRAENPGALLICHDGINHFQAIVPRQA